VKEVEKIIGKVEHHSIWWDRRKDYDNPPKMYITEIEIKPDVVGYYHLTPTHTDEVGKYIQSARWSWEEIHVVEFKSYIMEDLWKHEYQLSFYSVSSTHVRSSTPFLVLTMKAEMFNKWKEQDYWFRNDCHYIVRENGKKFYGGQDNNGEGKRCVVCRYLQKADATECEKGC
jgi:hypothetical protein